MPCEAREDAPESIWMAPDDHLDDRMSRFASNDPMVTETGMLQKVTTR